MNRIEGRQPSSGVAKTLVRLTLALVASIYPAFSARAADQLAYSFETDTNGFAANGGGTTVTQDTIGATDGTHSLQFAVVAGQTFTGALTHNLDPNIVGDPPGLDEVTFDLTITNPFPTGLPNTTHFNVLGVTVFGVSQPDFPGGQIGVQAQFIDFADPSLNGERHIDSLPAGTYKNFRIMLNDATNPITFDENQTFNQIFGTVGSGPNDVIPTGFEIYMNKSSDFPMTVYIDNVRFGTAVPGDYNADGVVDAADYVIWRSTLGATNLFVANGDNTGASHALIDQADYTFWKSRFGATSGAGSGSLGSGAVPEPASALLILSAVSILLARRASVGRVSS